MASRLHRVLSNAVEGDVEGSGFEELREAEFVARSRHDRETWMTDLLSVSSIAVQPESDRAAFAERLRELVPPGELRARRATGTLTVATHALLRTAHPSEPRRFTSADRVLFPDDGVTKGDLARLLRRGRAERSSRTSATARSR